MSTCPACNAVNDDAGRVCVGCGRRLPSRGVEPGSVVAGRYEILAVLGTGGMATVYRAHDRALDTIVALKVLNANPSQDPELARRFRSEIKLAWRVRHRNVCGIHEYGEDGDLLFISMELVEGRDLKRVIAEGGPMSWEQAYDVAIQVAEGLESIHAAGVIHRDLKPANITLDRSGLVRLMDFGIAKVWGEDSGGASTRAGHVVGSPPYMSPEQVLGRPLDFRSDLYALGLVIYELFTGRMPFRGETPEEVMLRRTGEDPDWENPAARLIPAAALPLLRKALARDPDKRQPSCGELLSELRAARGALTAQPTDSLNGGPAPGQAAAHVPPIPAPTFPRAAQVRLLVPPLRRALAHADDSVRLGALEALGRLGRGAREAAAEVAAALRDPAWQVRVEAARALPLLESPLAMEALRAARQDGDERVRAAALASLAGLDTPSAAELVRQPPPEPQPPQPQAAFAHSSPRRTATRLAMAAAGVLGLGALLFVLQPRGTPEARSPAASLGMSLPTPAWAEPTIATLPAVPAATLAPTPLPSDPTPALRAPPSTAGGRRPAPPPPPPPMSSLAIVPTVAEEPRRPGGARGVSEPTSDPRTAPEAGPAPSVESEESPKPSPVPAPLPSDALVTDSAPVPTAGPVVPPTCVKCAIPETVRVLQERRGLSPNVRIRVHVSEMGSVLRVEYLTGAPMLRDAITKAALGWRYQPARRGDTPVPAVVEVDVKF